MDWQPRQLLALAHVVMYLEEAREILSALPDSPGKAAVALHVSAGLKSLLEECGLLQRQLEAFARRAESQDGVS